MLNFLKQLFFINQETEKISHTKFWSNIGYASMVVTFLWAVIKGTTIDPVLWVLFGAIVIGNHTADKLLKYHFKLKEQTIRANINENAIDTSIQSDER